ncbi:hypothetical protein [Krasilnikovia sp. MM14-A1259]|uniref:hypothetical protein n=1 Tax=Krasilnikovia sp. MM14-A1259 TaxID=3373539 RepID=UPI0038280A3D
MTKDEGSTLSQTGLRDSPPAATGDTARVTAPGGSSELPGTPRRRTVVRTYLARLAGPVPARYWLLLAGLFLVLYTYWRYVGKPWTGDALYYTAMTFRYSGHGLEDAIRLTGEYFHDPNIQRLHRGFDNPVYAPLIYPRVVYPALSVPFVLLMGGSGMWVVPLLSALFVVWGLMRLLTRLFTAHVALAVTAFFMTTIPFLEFGTGLFTESPTLALVVGLMLLLPLGGRRFGAKEAVVAAILVVAITFCRQVTPVVVVPICAAWLWTALGQRQVRRNPWNLPLAVIGPVGIAVTMFVRWWAPYDIIEWFVHINGEPDVRTAFRHFPRIAWHLIVADTRDTFVSDRGMLLLWCVGLIACLVRPLSVHTGLLLGALGPSIFIATLNSQPTSMRYYLPMTPFLILAAAGLLHLLLTRPHGAARHAGYPGEAISLAAPVR